jgi:hypothetical protein
MWENGRAGSMGSAQAITDAFGGRTSGCNVLTDPDGRPHRWAMHHPGPSARVRANAPSSPRERDDGYRHVVVQLNDRWRVISCKDGLQWILQRRDAAKPHRAVWRGKRYHATREGLIASCVALAGLLESAAAGMLAGLPEWHPRKQA